MYSIVQIHPNKLLGVVGDHEDFPVEMLKVCSGITHSPGTNYNYLCIHI